jgi:hypothetical protein
MLHDNRHMKVVSLSVLSMCRFYPPPRKYFWYSFLLQAESIPGRAVVRPEGVAVIIFPLELKGSVTGHSDGVKRRNGYQTGDVEMRFAHVSALS